jgi:2',3'-cyclic-nucleotide 2'-phosphodiesterase
MGNDGMRILMVGDVCGKTGRCMAAKILPAARSRLAIDWIIANGENTTNGTGLAPRHAQALLAAGVDVLTTGNHLFARPDWPDVVARPQVLRPHNLGGDAAPGKGWGIFSKPGTGSLAVINLAGRVFMDPADCPFRWADQLLARIGGGIPVVVDIHAEATSEKLAMASYLAGRAALVAGTHTHVQTSDARLLPGGTAAISDLGMTGPDDGILGVDRETVLQRFRLGFSGRFQGAAGPGRLEGVLVILDQTGQPQAIRAVRLFEAGWEKDLEVLAAAMGQA